MLPALDGITVLDFASVGPAARCSRILADYGARVVKLGAAGRSVQIEPAYHSYSGSRWMQRARIDLKAPGGRDVFLRLAARADVVIESFRPGVVARLGIGYDDVRAVNPRIVYCSTSGYGQTGPMSQWAGHDLNYLAMGGFLHCNGRRADGGPPIPGATVADSAAGGMHAVVAIVSALFARERSGEGAYLDVSVADGVLWLMSLMVDQHLATGEDPGPGHDILTGRYACYDTYAARDDRWLAVGAIEPAFFAKLCRALDCERWIEHQLDDAAQDAMRRDFRAAFRRRDRDDWVAELGPADACVAPVNSIAEVARDPHLAARGAFSEASHPEHGGFRQLAPLLAGMRRAEGPMPLAPASKTDTDALLRETGMPGDEIERLRGDGVIA